MDEADFRNTYHYKDDEIARLNGVYLMKNLINEWVLISAFDGRRLRHGTLEWIIKQCEIYNFTSVGTLEVKK